MTCAFCGKEIEPGQPSLVDECGEKGDRVHLDCSIADQDGRDIDMEHGDSN